MTDYFVHSLAVVDEGAIIGANSKIWHFSHIRSTAKLGSNVIIGKNVYIDADVVVGWYIAGIRGHRCCLRY